MWKACILSAAFIQVIRCGSLGDESDLIIRTIFSNYESQAHPNSNREDGSVQIQIGLNPQSYELVVYLSRLSLSKFNSFYLHKRTKPPPC